MTTNKIASLLLLVSFSSFGYIRQVTYDALPVPLHRTDNTGIQFLASDKIVPGLQSNASGKSVTVFSAGSDPQAAIRASLATWNTISTANVKFLPLKTTSSGIDSLDNQMVIAVASTPGDLSAIGGALAVTELLAWPVDQIVNGVQVTKGEITDTDIILNPGIAFSTDGSTNVDLQSVVTHELGHSLSANHTGLLGASMFQFNSGQRFLTDDDVAFLNAAYPRSSGGAALGTLGGTITTAGAPVPFALLTIFDTSSGVSISALTNADGTYSISVPPGNYQLYAEPLNGALAINVYLSSDQAALAAATKFQTTQFTGSVNVTANNTATANITASTGASLLATPFVAATTVNGNLGNLVQAGPVTVASGQAVDIVFAGAGFDATLKDSNFTVFGPGISLRAGSVRVDSNFRVVLSPGSPATPVLRVTLDVAARTNPSLASITVTSGSNSLSLSGALIIAPPTPTFVSKGVISAASFLGSPNGDGAVSPGGIYSIYDIPNTPNLGPAAFLQNGPYDSYGYLSTLLGGVAVTFDGVPAPLFLSFGGQLNFQVPFEVAGKTSTKIVVNYLGSPSAAITVPVIPVHPGLFTSDGKAVRAYNLPDYTLNTAQTPAARGSYVEVYGSGVGKVSYVVQTGKGAPAFPTGFTGNYNYTIGGAPYAAALFGGWTPGTSGLAQWDVQVPASSATGAVPITVTDSATGASSQPAATIFVK